MPANWPELTLALALAVLAAYIVADLVARLVQSALRAILPDEIEKQFVDRPQRLIRVFIFLITAAAIALPALTLAGLQTTAGADRETLIRWLREHGLRIAVIGIVAYTAIRIGAAAARRFEREMSSGTGLDVIERTKRAHTLSRLLQKTLTVTISIIGALMVLGELGVNIMPFLTGAGIAGLAIGFGAQTLVRDVISGFFMILEDQVRVGDVVVVNGTGGAVEEVNLRTVVLRDEQGTVHVFPNGEVKTLANMSKDFAYYVITVGVGWDDDPDRVVEALRDAGESVASDPEYQPHVLAPLEMQGIDAFEPDRIVVKARIKTVPLKQWTVGRELRRRVTQLFRERGIHAPVRQTVFRVHPEAVTRPPREDEAERR